MATGFYPGSFDPITNGHLDIIERAIPFFDKVIIGIGSNSGKAGTFSINHRIQLAEEALRKFGDKIKVISFSGLSVDYVYINNLVMIRGLRDGMDFEYEKAVHDANYSQRKFECINFFTNPEVAGVSSSIVKEMQKHQGNILKYVPMNVKVALECVVSKRLIVGLTGYIGAGKTYVGKLLGNQIELDQIGRDLLCTDTRPFAVNMRNQLWNELNLKSIIGMKRPDNYNFIDPKVISGVIFKNKEFMNIYNEITKEPILCEMYQQLRKMNGIVYINSAILVEGGLLPICNNTFVFVTAPVELNIKRLVERGYSEEDIINRAETQMSGVDKVDAITKAVERDNFGEIFYINNNEDGTLNIQITELKVKLNKRYNQYEL